MTTLPALVEIENRAEAYRAPMSNWMSDDEAQQLYAAVKDRTELLRIVKEMEKTLQAISDDDYSGGLAMQQQAKEGLRRAAQCLAPQESTDGR